MYSDEIIEELERLQNEFGRARGQLPDQVEARYRYDVDRIEFDPVNQAFLFVSDH